MGVGGVRFSYFSSGDVELLRQRVFELLEKRGVRLAPQEEVFGLLVRAGAEVDRDSGSVRFPRRCIEELLREAPRRFELGALNPERRLEIPRPGGGFHLRTGTGAHGWLDPESGRHRPLTLADAAAWARLISRLPEIDFGAFPFPNDAPPATADVHALKTLLQNTDKHAWIQPYSVASLDYLIELAAAAAGGEAGLRKNPLVSFIACSLTPLEFKTMDLEVILKASRMGLPIHACSLPSAGGTAPITLPGLVVLASAEILAMAALVQACRPGCPVIAAPIVFSLDMRSGRSRQSSAEAMQAAAAAVQFIRAAFDLPTHTYGSGSDSLSPDGQSMAERALLGLLVGLSGADILGGAGQLESATALSPVQLVIDNELAAVLRRLLAGPAVDDETLAWADLLAAEPGGHFLTTAHTLRHCRDGLDPRVFASLDREAWDRAGRPDPVSRALELCRAEMGRQAEGCLDRAAAVEMEAIAARADRSLQD